MTKKLVVIVLILAMTSTLFAGCTKKEEAASDNTTDIKTEEKAEEKTEDETADTAETTEVSDEKVEINYMTFSAGPDHIEDLESIINAFETENNNIKVNYEILSWDSYFTRLQTLVAGGTAPDTFELNYENFITYASNNTLLSLDDMIAEDNVDMSVYNQKALEAFKQKGEQFGLVESFSNVVLFYNKELFDNAGLEYPQPDWTWEDELNAAEALTDEANGIWGTYSPVQFWEFYKTIAQNGGAIFNEDKTEVVINSPENVETLQWMIDKVEKYHVTPSMDQMSGQTDGDLFVGGKIAMLRTGIWMFDAFMDAPFEWDIALEPGNTQKAHHFFANGVVVSSETEQPEASWKWIQFLTSSDFATQIRVDTGWELPAVENDTVLEGY
jgi:multiple sugar transport system substrate-binding protein